MEREGERRIIFKRTNDSAEGWHKGFDIRINTTHPTLSKLIHKILIEQSNSEIKLERFRSGYDLAKSKKRYVQLNKSIEKLVDEYIHPTCRISSCQSHNLSLIY